MLIYNTVIFGQATQHYTETIIRYLFDKNWPFVYVACAPFLSKAEVFATYPCLRFARSFPAVHVTFCEEDDDDDDKQSVVFGVPDFVKLLRDAKDLNPRVVIPNDFVVISRPPENVRKQLNSSFVFKPPLQEVEADINFNHNIISSLVPST